MGVGGVRRVIRRARLPPAFSSSEVRLVMSGPAPNIGTSTATVSIRTR
jgi:hypothetical protein